MAAKRIRFGIVFEGTLPALEDGHFLGGLGIVEAEGCTKDGNHFMLITVGRPRKTIDVEQAIKLFNSSAPEAAITPVSFQGGPFVVTFERGHKFQLHPIYQTIQSANQSGDSAYWTWGLIEGKKRRRVMSELESDLVEASILPTAPKRASGKENSDAQVMTQPSEFLCASGCYGLLCIGTPRHVWGFQWFTDCLNIADWERADVISQEEAPLRCAFEDEPASVLPFS
jgi:hypothetical protein